MDRDATIATEEAVDRSQPTTLAEISVSSNAKLTIERRGQLVLFGINRPYIQNRIDPETFRAMAKAYYDYDRDPSLRAARLLSHDRRWFGRRRQEMNKVLRTPRARSPSLAGIAQSIVRRENLQNFHYRLPR